MNMFAIIVAWSFWWSSSDWMMMLIGVSLRGQWSQAGRTPSREQAAPIHSSRSSETARRRQCQRAREGEAYDLDHQFELYDRVMSHGESRSSAKA